MQELPGGPLFPASEYISLPFDGENWFDDGHSPRGGDERKH